MVLNIRSHRLYTLIRGHNSMISYDDVDEVRFTKAALKKLLSNMERCDRAIALLGIVAKGVEVNKSVRHELMQLIGFNYPEPDDAARLKQKLKAARKRYVQSQAVSQGVPKP